MTSGAELLNRVEALVPMIEAHAAGAEAERKPVDTVMQALADTDVFRAFVPRRFGGLEIDLDSFVRIGMALARGCTSTAWVTTFCMEHNWLLAHFPQAAQEEVWGAQPYFLAPGSISPSGKAGVVEGGYQVSGRWQWGTGVMHADWVMLAALIEGDQPDMRMFMVPRDQVGVEDTWYIDGMVGTGSNDVVAEDVFVPAHMSQSVALMGLGQTEGAAWHDSPTFKLPMLPFKCITAAAPAVGAAQRAVELFAERIKQRTLWGSNKTQQSGTAAQMRLGRLSIEAEQTAALMVHVAGELAALAGEPTTPTQRARLRLACANLVHRSRDIVRDVMEASGASAHFLSNPMQRIHRDVHTLSCHTVFDMDVGTELYGQTLLELPTSSPV